MTGKSAKNKGYRYEKHIAESIRESGLDSKASREIGSGSGNAKGDIRSTIPFLIEAKNQRKISVLAWIDQAKEQAQKGWAWKDRWCLVFRDPRVPETASADYVVIDFQEFLEMLKRWSEPKLKEPDRNLKYKLEMLRKTAHEVIKELEE